MKPIIEISSNDIRSGTTIYADNIWTPVITKARCRLYSGISLITGISIGLILASVLADIRKARKGKDESL